MSLPERKDELHNPGEAYAVRYECADFLLIGGAVLAGIALALAIITM